MERGEIVGIIEQLADPVLADLGFVLVDAHLAHEAGRWVLRLKIDHLDARGPTSHVTVEDCTRVSRALSAVLDVEAQIPMSYTLEVSSPGLDRRLRREADFQRFVGSAAEIRTKIPINGCRAFHGVLGPVSNAAVEITVDQMQHEIPIECIEKAKLKY